MIQQDFDDGYSVGGRGRLVHVVSVQYQYFLQRFVLGFVARHFLVFGASLRHELREVLFFCLRNGLRLHNVEDE